MSEFSTQNPKIKGLKPTTGRDTDEMAEYLTHNPKIGGSNPNLETRREIKWHNTPTQNPKIKGLKPATGLGTQIKWQNT
jgi:hypothetical protein